MARIDDIRRPIDRRSPRLLDQLRLHMRAAPLAYTTEKTYLHWICSYIRYHQRRHPRDLGAPNVDAYLSWLASEQRVSPATQSIALNALIYLYKRFLRIELGQLNFRRARPKRRVPQVLTHEEALRVIALLRGSAKLVVQLLYGSVSHPMW